MLGMSARPEPVRSVNKAYARLGRILARDRLNTCPSRLTGNDRIWLLLEKFEPISILEKFAGTQPLPDIELGEKIKWRKMVPFEANVR